MPEQNNECKKVKFADQKSADFYIKKLKDTSHRQKRPVSTYLCPICLSWHLSSRTHIEDMQIAKMKETIRIQKEHIKSLENKISELKLKLKPNNGY